MISPASGIHRPSYNGAPAMQTHEPAFQPRKLWCGDQPRTTRAAPRSSPAKSQLSSVRPNVRERVCPRRSKTH